MDGEVRWIIQREIRQVQFIRAYTVMYNRTNREKWNALLQVVALTVVVTASQNSCLTPI
jgi:hypothetical protein